MLVICSFEVRLLIRISEVCTEDCHRSRNVAGRVYRSMDWQVGMMIS